MPEGAADWRADLTAGVVLGGGFGDGVGRWRPLTGRGLSPEDGEIELDGLEGLGAHAVGALVEADDQPGPLMQSEHLEGAEVRVENPGMADPVAGGDRQLADAGVPRRGG